MFTVTRDFAMPVGKKRRVQLHSPCKEVNDNVCPGSVLTAPSLTLAPEGWIARAVLAVFHVTGQAAEELRIRVVTGLRLQVRLGFASTVKVQGPSDVLPDRIWKQAPAEPVLRKSS